MVIDFKFFDIEGKVHNRPTEGVRFSHATVVQRSTLMLPHDWLEVAKIERRFLQSVRKQKEDFKGGAPPEQEYDGTGLV